MAEDNKIKITECLKQKPDAVLDFISRDLSVPLSEVIECLSPDQVTKIPGNQFEAVMEALSRLGQITFIVHTKDIVLECKGQIPQGSYGRGYYNIHGDSPIGGHIKAENCGSIYLLSRMMMGRPSHVAIICNKAGSAMFKVYLGRDENKELLPEQVEMFQAMKANFKTEPNLKQSQV